MTKCKKCDANTYRTETEGFNRFVLDTWIKDKNGYGCKNLNTAACRNSQKICDGTGKVCQ